MFFCGRWQGKTAMQPTPLSSSSPRFRKPKPAYMRPDLIGRTYELLEGWCRRKNGITCTTREAIADALGCCLGTVQRHIDRFRNPESAHYRRLLILTDIDPRSRTRRLVVALPSSANRLRPAARGRHRSGQRRLRSGWSQKRRWHAKFATQDDLEAYLCGYVQTEMSFGSHQHQHRVSSGGGGKVTSPGDFPRKKQKKKTHSCGCRSALFRSMAYSLLGKLGSTPDDWNVHIVAPVVAAKLESGGDYDRVFFDLRESIDQARSAHKKRELHRRLCATQGREPLPQIRSVSALALSIFLRKPVRQTVAEARERYARRKSSLEDDLQREQAFAAGAKVAADLGLSRSSVSVRKTRYGYVYNVDKDKYTLTNAELCNMSNGLFGASNAARMRTAAEQLRLLGERTGVDLESYIATIRTAAGDLEMAR